MDLVGLDVFACLSEAPISSCQLASFKFLERAVNANQKDIEPSEKLSKFVTPSRKLDQVIHNQVVSCTCKGGNAAMETSEKSRPNRAPVRKRTFYGSARIKGLRKVIRRNAKERRWHGTLDTSRKRRLSGA